MNKRLPLNEHGFEASRLALGCMRLGGGWNRNPLTAEDAKEAHAAIDAALGHGINLFDHADVYAFGKAEQVFGKALKERPELRERMILQSKCGIRFGEEGFPWTRFDFSKEHILASVDGILERLGTDRLDILLLHRPDPLADPEEVAEAFGRLKAEGKVRKFGVSNMGAGQMKLLQAYLDEPLVANQLELGLHKLDWLDAGVHMNQEAGKLSSFPEGVLEYCRLNKVQIQAWGPLAKGLYGRADLTREQPAVQMTAALIGELAEEKGVSKEAIVLAFLLRHPANVQPVVGTVNPARIAACAEACRTELSREDWYKLYITSRGRVMP